MIFFYRLIRALTSPISRLNRWANSGIDRCRRNQLRRRFPKGCKVRATAVCPCGRKHAGKAGVVGEMTTDHSEFWVKFRDEDDILCPKGMERI